MTGSFALVLAHYDHGEQACLPEATQEEVSEPKLLREL